MRKCWFEVFEEVERENRQRVEQAGLETQRMQERAWRAERMLDVARDELTLRGRRVAELEEELEELKGENSKLTSQVNKDFENSSLPSSAQGPARKRIPNGRVPSTRAQGAQTGRTHHPRKHPAPTSVIDIADPADYIEDPDLYKTGGIISKFSIRAHVAVDVVEYRASEWRRRSNGARLHASFPSGVRNDVNYDGSSKAPAFLLANECCTSVGKTKRLLYEASGGVLDLSTGMICGLAKEFSSKSEAERTEAVKSLMTNPVMHADFTVANLNGKTGQVLVLANEGVSMMYARGSKGHKGIKGTPLENYVGCVSHDHDKTFYSYGSSHQECMQHNIRYLIGSVQNEPELTWNTNMLELVREMLHWRRRQSPDMPFDKAMTAEFERRYDECLQLAEAEYEARPPAKYYRDGCNLFTRLKEYRKSELLFLHDIRVPPDNSICERLARVFKRKMHQAIVFRSFESLSCICDAIGKINNMRTHDKDVFVETSDIFNRMKPSAQVPPRLCWPMHEQ